jgi:hypothetical protein
MTPTKQSETPRIPRDDEIRLVMGELTADQMRTARAAIRWILNRAAPEPAVPKGWKLLKDTTHEERSYPEDSQHENGNYSCGCCVCLREFVGHKRRVICKVCAAAPEEK